MAQLKDPIRLSVPAHQSVEWALAALKNRPNPWEEITVTAILTDSKGAELRIPAFWNGGSEWCIRLTASLPGTWQVRIVCSDTSDTGLHGQQAVLEVTAAKGDNPLFKHGAVRISNAGGYFEHADGTPFLWLGDTWWMLMSERVSWPDGYKKLTAHRVSQGFNVAQIVVGFPPDTTPFDGRDSNAGGSPWEKDYARINPEYFKACDRRIAHLVESGIVPCILGSWGYHLKFMGKERMISHWRYLVARYAAWPVIWCLAGEGAMAFYLSKQWQDDSDTQKKAWPEVARAVRSADPWHRPISIHPRSRSWEDIADPSTLDFHMLQPGHLPNGLISGVESLAVGRDSYPGMAIVNAEPPYEGHGGMNGPEIQRYAYWSTMLSGGKGFTYGAAGIFQANDRDRPTGNRPDGGAFDNVFWDDSMLLPGAAQIAAGHKLLMSLPFHKFEPHPEWISVPLRWGGDVYQPRFRAYAAGIPGECRLAYIPLRWYHWDGPVIKQLEPGVRYHAEYIEPNTLKHHYLGIINGDATGEWHGPTLPHLYDWLVLLRKA